MEPFTKEKYQEKRKKYRKNCRYMPVDFVYNQRLERGLIVNISEAGACVENTGSISEGHLATMTFLENHDRGPVKTTCRIVRTFDNGFAVNFDMLTLSQAEAIHHFVFKDK
ncbi:MAG: PilZ domain-containing protein [Proteobacteria bacterium]|nr:PilZ domain-containing protein [Pseudomonadota bacterium]